MSTRFLNHLLLSIFRTVPKTLLAVTAFRWLLLLTPIFLPGIRTQIKFEMALLLHCSIRFFASIQVRSFQKQSQMCRKNPSQTFSGPTVMSTWFWPYHCLFLVQVFEIWPLCTCLMRFRCRHSLILHCTVESLLNFAILGLLKRIQSSSSASVLLGAFSQQSASKLVAQIIGSIVDYSLAQLHTLRICVNCHWYVPPCCSHFLFLVLLPLVLMFWLNCWIHYLPTTVFPRYFVSETLSLIWFCPSHPSQSLFSISFSFPLLFTPPHSTFSMSVPVIAIPIISLLYIYATIFISAPTIYLFVNFDLDSGLVLRFLLFLAFTSVLRSLLLSSFCWVFAMDFGVEILSNPLCGRVHCPIGSISHTYSLHSYLIYSLH